MNYVTVAEFITHASTSVMDDLMGNYSGTDVNERQEQILNEAEGTVDSYAAVKWSIPLYVDATVASYGIKKSVLNIALFLLYQQMQGDDIPERIKTTYVAELEWLEKLAKGEVFPPPGQDGVSPSVTDGGSSISIASDDSVFDSDAMEVF